MVFTVRWGVLGAGHISGVFVRDALLDPKTRGTEDVVHQVTVIGSRSVESAQAFIDKNIKGGDLKNVTPYGSYEDAVKAPNVDAFYVGTPHTYHYDCVVLALNAGKHVLCEKPATSNAAEWKALVALAKSKNLFIMEAMWTRFLPVTLAMEKIIRSGELGELKVVHADLSGDFGLDNIPDTHRILDPKLGGGGLLDLGPYPMIWAIMALYEDPRNNKRPPTRVSGGMVKTARTGVDSSCAWTLDFQHLDAQAILSTSITLPSMPDAAVLRFRGGNIVIPRPIYKPGKFTVQKFAKPGSSDIVSSEEHEFSSKLVGGGWHFQADEVARCIRDGKIESAIWSHDKTTVQMEIFDEVRRQGDYKFPAGVEKVV